MRVGARFCQQCGAVMETGGAAPAAGKADATATAEDAPAVELLAENWERWEESVRGSADSAAGRTAPSRQDSEARPVGDAEAPPSGVEHRVAHNADGAAEAAGGGEPAAADGRQGAADARRKRRPATVMKENLRPRVERMREASIVVLEEAAEDSGLRFVLISVLLFLLFLLFLFISSFLR